MTTKDLNLSLDRGLFQPKATGKPGAAAGRSGRGTDGRATRQAGKPKPGKPVPRQTPKSWQAVVTSTMAIANMLFLVLAAIWLSGYAGQPTTRPDAPEAGISPQVEAVQNGIDLRIDALEQQLENIQIAINAQQQLIVSAYQDIGEKLVGVGSPPQASTPAAPTGHEADDAVQPDRDWHVNLGTFSRVEAATEVRSQLEALGYQAQIVSVDLDDSMAHKVILPDFEDRESAEVAATLLMEKTELDSLSVWKGS